MKIPSPEEYEQNVEARKASTHKNLLRRVSSTTDDIINRLKTGMMIDSFIIRFNPESQQHYINMIAAALQEAGWRLERTTKFAKRGNWPLYRLRPFVQQKG